jgi:hypothetical protein
MFIKHNIIAVIQDSFSLADDGGVLVAYVDGKRVK